MLLGELDVAWSLMEKVLNKHIEDGFMYFIAGKIKYLQGEFEDAKMYYIKSYELEKAFDTEQMLGLCYFELKNYEQALSIFKHILSENRNNINIMLNIARCYKELDNKDMALKTLEEVTEILPECEEAQELIRELA